MIFNVCISLQEKDKPNSTTMNGSPGSGVVRSEQMGVKIEPAEAESLSTSGSSGILTPVSPFGYVKPISPEQEELIHRLVYFQNEYEQPSEEDLKRITVSVYRNLSPIPSFLECKTDYEGVLCNTLRSELYFHEKLFKTLLLQ